jgi:hypothetical protein
LAANSERSEGRLTSLNSTPMRLKASCDNSSRALRSSGVLLVLTVIVGVWATADPRHAQKQARTRRNRVRMLDSNGLIVAVKAGFPVKPSRG